MLYVGWAVGEEQETVMSRGLSLKVGLPRAGVLAVPRGSKSQPCGIWGRGPRAPYLGFCFTVGDQFLCLLQQSFSINLK